MKRISQFLKEKPTNHFMVFLPFLILYCFLIFRKSEEKQRKDEWRYIYYAENLLEGEYSPKGIVFLWSGPGYPIIIAPFIGTGTPTIIIKLLNGFFLYFSIILLFRMLLNYLKVKRAFIISILWAIYWPAYEMLHYMMTEPFTIFLISLITYYTVKLFREKKYSASSIVSLGMLLGFLALTKLIFGYVLLVGLIIYALLFAIKRSKTYQTSTLVYFVALLFCTPYLLYTYNISNKVFYWGNAGGMQLYWMSSPHKEEMGDWINFTYKPSKYDEVNQLFKSRHQPIHDELMNNSPFMEGISQDKLIKISNVKQDEGFKKQAIINIREHPNKYFENWIANISRMLFNAPYSYKAQSADYLRYLIINGPILLLSFVGLILTYKNFKSISFEVKFLLFFASIYFGGSSLISAYPRQFYIIVPILFLWISYVFNKYFKIRLNNE